ncbi:hypothetical protein [Arthrobacter sp. NEB 688]|uniref:hypothetical protein n=1 Tax=Arthrobacter sp. NEB 688 TaxID=904039 RepID=UPI001563E15F|nr:hypothetical protein [Arthrobacter sp. NEB 688]QKE84551.1 hypothetical protein HL663_11770 [Arthrobacter sp. NEB 688]
MTAQRWHEDVGSVAEEAGRLLESLRRAGREGAPEPDAAAPPGADAPAASDADTPPAQGFSCDDPVCQWCPVCRASGFVRQLSPETLGTLAELAGFAAAVLGDLASARGRAHDDQQGGDRG